MEAIKIGFRDPVGFKVSDHFILPNNNVRKRKGKNLPKITKEIAATISQHFKEINRFSNSIMDRSNLGRLTIFDTPSEFQVKKMDIYDKMLSQILKLLHSESESTIPSLFQSKVMNGSIDCKLPATAPNFPMKFV